MRRRKRTHSSSSVVSRDSAEQVSKLLITAVHFSELKSESTSFYEGNDSMFPTIVGFNKAIHDTINICLDKVEKDVDSFLREDNDKDNEKREGASDVHFKDISDENLDDVHLLYRVSGSGKTRRIEHLLHSEWGYYLLPGNVDPTEQRNRGNLYDPQRGEYSKDSCVLWRLLQKIDKIMPGMEISPFQVDHWIRRLILSRHLIFDRFPKVAKERQDITERQAMTPAKWLRFQKSCSILDPFETLFKLLLLVNSGYVDSKYKTPHLNHVLKEKVFYFCLDEAQRCLDTPLLFNNISSYEDENILPLICRQILLYSKFSERFRNPNPGLRFIVGGTSLKLKKTVSTIESTRQWRRSERHFTSTKCRTFTDFPLLTSDQELLKLIEKRGLAQRINTDLAPVIKERGVPLRGRYLWSALYVDHLKEHFKKHGKLDEQAISEAANETIDKARRSLKERLSQLQKKKYHKI